MFSSYIPQTWLSLLSNSWHLWFKEKIPEFPVCGSLPHLILLVNQVVIIKYPLSVWCLARHYFSLFLLLNSWFIQTNEMKIDFLFWLQVEFLDLLLKLWHSETESGIQCILRCKVDLISLLAICLYLCPRITKLL